MPDVSPKFESDPPITCHANAAIVGGRCVDVVGPSVDGNTRVGPPAAAGLILGVAARDAAAGDKVGVYAGPGTVVPIANTAAAVAAGEELEVDATGLVLTLAAGVAVARAMDDAAASTTVLARLY